MKYFGEPYPSRKLPAPIYEPGDEIETPVGQPCGSCDVPIEEGDQGFYLPHYDGVRSEVLPWHRRCLLVNTVGVELADYIEDEVSKGNVF